MSGGYGSGTYGSGTYSGLSSGGGPVSRTLATPLVQIAWSTTLSGAFTIGTSTIGGTAVLPGVFGPAALTFTDVTRDVKEASGTRGRDSTLSAMQEGTCHLVLKDTTGKYNPDNPASSLAGQLVPGRPVKVTQTHLGVTYGLFYGVIASLESHPARDERECLIDCVDLFEWLNVSYPVIAATGATTVGVVIGLILDAIDWTATNYRQLDTGSSIPDFSADGGTSALQLIADLLTVDMGCFFIDGDGVATYQSRDRRFQVAPVVDTLTGTSISNIAPRVDLQAIRNRARVTRTGGAQQTAEDATSESTYGIRDVSAITSAYLNDDAQAANLASLLVALQKDPRSPARGVTLFNKDDTAIVQQLAREVGDRVTVSESLGGSSFTGTIEAIAWAITGAARFQQTEFLVSKRVMGDFFQIGLSALGGTNGVGY